MEKKEEDAALKIFPSPPPRRPTPDHPPYIEMIQEALIEHGGVEGLTAEAIDERIKATHHDLPFHHNRLFRRYLNVSTYNTFGIIRLILDEESGRYIIPGKAQYDQLKAAASAAPSSVYHHHLAKLEAAEKTYRKYLVPSLCKRYLPAKKKTTQSFVGSSRVDSGVRGGDKKAKPKSMPKAKGPRSQAGTTGEGKKLGIKIRIPAKPKKSFGSDPSQDQETRSPPLPREDLRG